MKRVNKRGKNINGIAVMILNTVLNHAVARTLLPTYHRCRASRSAQNRLNRAKKMIPKIAAKTF